MDFSKTIITYDIKGDLCNQLNELINTKGHGHLLTLVLGPSDSV